MCSAAIVQNQLHELLTSYINGGCLTRADVACSLVSSRLPFERNARRVIEAHQALRSATAEESSPQETITIEPYDGDNPFVRRMMTLLASGLQENLVGAYVHGSMATCEEIAYSDFDALVILRDHVFEDRKRLVDTAVQLSQARRIMFNADPLQHHGWFILTESDLPYYCDAYFPRIVFSYSKSMLNDRGDSLSLAPRNSIKEIRDNFNRVAISFLQLIENSITIRNLYLIKCALSQFMLLPALYVQTRYGMGIYKKCSFQKARQDFNTEEWNCVDRISHLRDEWLVQLNPLTKTMLSQPGILRKYAATKLVTAVPEHIRTILTPELTRQMVNLVRRMQTMLSQPSYTWPPGPDTSRTTAPWDTPTS
jgi:predicted nucleotidyltransferase